MSEILTTYLLDDLDQPMPMGRDEFYDSQIECAKKGEKPNRAVAIVDVLLFTLDGEVIIQKRSSNKRHNAGLLDKSLGGHITFGDTPDFTVMTETLQELEIAAIVLDSEEDFKKTFKAEAERLEAEYLLEETASAFSATLPPVVIESTDHHELT